ncbi:MAG: chloride channel protein [Bryobacteraceae bacterium]
MDPQLNRRHEDKILLLLTLIIGAIVGLVVVAFIFVTENLGARMYPPGGAPWRRLVLPVIGALSTGILLTRYFPTARGSGIPQTKAALFLRDGFISFRTVLGKFGLCSVSLASGIALGREGPSVQVGSGIASVLGRRLGLTPSRVRALVPIGSSAALAAAFNTPIAAVLFSLEEVTGDLNAPVLGSIVLSSATSWIVLHLLLGDEPLFHVPAYQLVHPIEFSIYALLGVVGGLVSVGFVKLLLWMRLRFHAMPASTEWLQPAAGGLLVGALGWFVPQVLGVGYGNVSLALNGQIAIGTMALLVVLKVVATAGCYASGNAGGIFGPALFMGAMTGGAIGGAAHLLLPDYTAGVGAYALVGMGAAFAGIVRVPLTSVIMIFEVTRDYAIIVPLMIANLISYFISSRLQAEPIYEALQHQDNIYLPSGARGREEVAVVGDGIRPVSAFFHPDDTVRAAFDSTGGVPGTWAVAAPGGVLGMITTAQLEQAVRDGQQESTLAELVAGAVAPPAASEGYPYVYRDEPIDSALRRMGDAGVDILPVVSRTDLGKVIGVISSEDALAAYGVGGRRKRPAKAPDESGIPFAKLALVGGVLAGMLLLAVSLGYLYRAQRVTRAREYFQAANQMVAAGRFADSIEPYRHALSISASEEYRLALASALVHAQRLDEAAIYFREVLRVRPNSGPANCGLAEVYAGSGQIDEAVVYYHHAVYGVWPDNAPLHRAETRMELAVELGKTGRNGQAQAALLASMAEMPADPAIRKRVARLLLAFGLPQQGAEVFREVLQRGKDDAEAFAGLGDAEAAQWKYVPACAAFRHALRIKPGDAAIGQSLESCEAVLAIDPSSGRLPAAERFARSRKLLGSTVAALDQCVASRPDFRLPETAAPLEDRARKELASRRKPQSYADASDDDVALARQLWDALPDSCRTPGTPLDKVVAHLSQ